MLKAIGLLSLGLGVVGLAAGAVAGLIGTLRSSLAADVGATGALLYWLLAILLPAGLYVMLYSLRDDDDFEAVFDRSSSLRIILAVSAALGGALATATYVVGVSVVPTAIATVDPLVIRQSFADHSGLLVWVAVWAVSVVVGVGAGVWQGRSVTS